MSDSQLYTIILRHDTSSQWMIVNPILTLGEYGVEDDTHRIKRGDGIHTWSDLTYDHFGFEYAITFANLQGDIDDNEKLKEAFANTITKEDFGGEEGKILLDINVTHQGNVIASLSKVTKDISTKTSTTSTLVNIVSDDNTLNGTWSTNDSGISVLNLSARNVVADFSETESYKKYQMCIYNKALFRAVKDLDAGPFDESNWESLSSGAAKQIEFDPSGTSITATTVQGAIGELDTKLAAVEDEVELHIV